MRGYLVKCETTFSQMGEYFVPEDLYRDFLTLLSDGRNNGRIFESCLTDRKAVSDEIPTLTEESFGYIVDYECDGKTQSVFVPTPYFKRVISLLDRGMVRQWTNIIIFNQKLPSMTE